MGCACLVLMVFFFVTVDWEGPEALEECSDATRAPVREPTPQPSESDREEEPVVEPESDSDGGSEDEYVAAIPAHTGATITKVCVLHSTA